VPEGAEGPGDCLEIDLGDYHLSVATSFGPRVLGIRRGDGHEQFAALPDHVVIDRPDSGVYRFRGGHRLWAAPEIPWISYAPDDEPCEVVTRDGGVEIQGPVDRAGLAKRVALTLELDTVVVDHTLDNLSEAPLAGAPWAITQLPLGGTALVPIRGKPDQDGLQANRVVVLWPYTDPADPRLTWKGDVAVIDASPGPTFKIGTGPAPEQIGYLHQGQLFSKRVTASSEGSYPDLGAVGQFFMNDQFCELESIGPLTRLEPGSTVSHRERWTIHDCPDLGQALALVAGEGPV
jgi:hypothetical protein